jgi:hypothetical protein
LDFIAGAGTTRLSAAIVGAGGGDKGISAGGAAALTTGVDPKDATAVAVGGVVIGATGADRGDIIGTIKADDAV